MGVRVVFGIHALVLLAAGVLWFLPRDGPSMFEAHGWQRAALIAATWVAVLVHLTLLLRKHRSISPALLTLPLLLPAFAGVVVGMARIHRLSGVLADDPGNPSFCALVVWGGVAESAADFGLGAWMSGMLLLTASVGAAALMVSRGWVTVRRATLQSLAIGLALIVASTLVRFSGAQRLLGAEVVAWGSIVATLSLLLLGARTGRGMRAGWQSTLLRTIGLMMPLGVAMTLGGACAIREGYLVNLAVDTGAFGRLNALSASVRAMDGTVGALVLGGALIASWGMLSAGAPTSRKGRLVLSCCVALWLVVIGSMSTVRSARARQLEAWSASRLHSDDVEIPTVGRGYDAWVPDVPAVVVPNEGKALLVTGSGEVRDLSTAAMGKVPASNPPPPRPVWPDANKEGGCVMGRELPGMRLPGATLVVDRRVTLQALSASVGPLSTTTPRVFALLTLREGLDKVRGLPSPWQRVMRLGATDTALLRVEPSVQRALRPISEVTPDRYVAVPEGGGLRVVSMPGVQDAIDRVIMPDSDESIGNCDFSIGCNARPSEFVVGFPPSWEMARIAKLLGVFQAAKRWGFIPAYRAHHVLTLTPDIHGVRAVLRDAQTKNAGAAEQDR